jgi:hypothetical protein
MPERIRHAGKLEAAMLGRGIVVDIIDWLPVI